MNEAAADVTSRDGAPAIATGESEAPLIEVRGLKKHFHTGGLLSGQPVKAVDGVSFDIRRGETLGLVGESGCGKTTLGRTIIQLETATEGSIRAGDTDITALSGKQLREWQRDAQMVFQDPDSSLNSRMTVGEIIREPLEAHDWGTRPERDARVAELIEAVGLQEEHFYRYPHQFSGGQLQRIGIARALALEPEFIVLDEPVSALDVSVQARIINLLEDLQAEFGLTYLFIAHDLAVVRHIADRVAVMYLGNIVELGPTETVFNEPAHPYTQSLLSAIPGSAGPERERITLRGAPPNPRYPPPGCPFATRCPAKIHPPDYDLDDDLWAAIEAFRVVLRERARAESSLTESVKRRLGIGQGADSVGEIRADLFEGLEVPATVETELDAAADTAGGGDDLAGAEAIRSTFGSVCDREHPDPYDVSTEAGERFSRCLRHDDEFREPEPVIQERSRSE
jgi:peptide/nickel transport system ATP-binding protein